MDFFNVSFSFFLFYRQKKIAAENLGMQTKDRGNRDRFIVNTALKRLGWESRFLRKSNDSNSATHLHIYGISISSLTVGEDSLEETERSSTFVEFAED